MGRYDYHLNAVNTIDLSRIGPETAAILKAAMSDAGGRDLLPRPFTETLDAIPVPDCRVWGAGMMIRTKV